MSDARGLILNEPSHVRLGGPQCGLKRLEFGVPLKFIIPVEPEGKKEARRTRNGHVFKDPETRAAMQAIAESVRGQYRGEPLDCPLALRVVAWKTRPKSKPKDVYVATKPDYDNIEKLIGDALEGIVWVNDSRIVDGRCVKKYAPAGVPGWIEMAVTSRLDEAETNWSKV